MDNNIELRIQTLPEKPGCYLMEHNQKVIYVGKAKNLKNRVKSYFVGAHNQKTTNMVSDITDFHFIVTSTENESLILELNLIKQYKPKYNILLMDDKTYPYIILTNEPYPRLIVSREDNVDAKYFGPYPSSYSAKQTAYILNKIYPFRKCNKIPKKECLYYHINECLAPCVNKNIDYTVLISEVTKFLKGDSLSLISEIEKKMYESSENLDFEKAKEYRDLVKELKNTTQKQVININDNKTRDFIGYDYNENILSLNIVNMVSGHIIDNYQIVFSYIKDYKEELLTYLALYYENKINHLDELVFSEQFDILDIEQLFSSKAKIVKIGDKKKIVDMSIRNATENLKNYYLLYQHKNEYLYRALKELEDIFGKEIVSIESVDNSHLFGSDPIAGLIKFEDYQFNRKEYRKYHLKTSTSSDYDSMKEVVYRRYYRLLCENKKMPDLLLVDGGQIQVHAATQIIKSLNLDIIVAGLIKNDNHKLRGLYYNEKEINIDKNDDLFKFLLSISEEVHRFSITFHRKTHTKSSFMSVLEKVDGVGKVKKNLLLKHFSSITEIKNATIEELVNFGIDKKTANNLKESLKYYD
ncbi:MAG: excinuclease ABC subunit UvrC [Acholeplasmatales bacterium]|jgi:excinuclease ABC subunit C|nr:excinuclease ABC subunit UvrC [Acholeplasmatales bacterium]